MEPLFGLDQGDDLTHIIESSGGVSDGKSQEDSPEENEITLAPVLATLGVKKVSPGRLEGCGVCLVKDIYPTQQRDRNMIDTTGNYPTVRFNEPNQRYLRYGNIYEDGTPVDLFETKEIYRQEIVLTHKTTRLSIYDTNMLFMVQIFAIEDTKVKVLEVLTSNWFCVKSHSKNCDITKRRQSHGSGRGYRSKKRRFSEDDSEESFSV